MRFEGYKKEETKETAKPQHEIIHTLFLFAGKGFIEGVSTWVRAMVVARCAAAVTSVRDSYLRRPAITGRIATRMRAGTTVARARAGVTFGATCAALPRT
jgi:hypothetical protein